MVSKGQIYFREAQNYPIQVSLQVGGAGLGGERRGSMPGNASGYGKALTAPGCTGSGFSFKNYFQFRFAVTLSACAAFSSSLFPVMWREAACPEMARVGRLLCVPVSGTQPPPQSAAGMQLHLMFWPAKSDCAIHHSKIRGTFWFCRSETSLFCKSVKAWQKKDSHVRKQKQKQICSSEVHQSRKLPLFLTFLIPFAVFLVPLLPF